MSKKLDQIKSRIQKLLTLSDDKGATAEEASLAASMAAKLMDEYNLSRDEFGKGDDFNVKPGSVPFWIFTGEHIAWRMRIGVEVAEDFSCRFLGLSAKNSKYKVLQFVGEGEDGIIAAKVAHFIFEKALEMSKISYRARPAHLKNVRSSAYRRDYLEGYSANVAARLRDKRKEREVEAYVLNNLGIVPISMSIVTVQDAKKEAVEKYMSVPGREPRIRRTISAPKPKHQDSYIYGYLDALTVNLSPEA